MLESKASKKKKNKGESIDQSHGQHLAERVPNEVLSYLFAFLDPKDVGQAALVCKRWYAVSTDNHIWKSFLMRNLWTAPTEGCKEAFKAKALSFKQWAGNDELYFRCIRVENTPPSAFTCIYDFHYEGNTLLTGSSSAADNLYPLLRVWDTTDGIFKQRAIYEMEHAIFKLKVHSSILVTGSRQASDYATGVLKISKLPELPEPDKKSKKKLPIVKLPSSLTLTGHTSAINCIEFDGSRIASGSEDWSIRCWDAEAGKCTHHVTGFQKQISCIQTDFDNQTIVSGSWDNSVMMFDLRTNKPVRQFKGHKYSVTALQYQGEKLLTASDDGTIKVWDMGTELIVENIQLNSFPELATTRVASKEERKEALSLSPPYPIIHWLQFDEQKMVTGFVKGAPALWDLKTMQPVRSFALSSEPKKLKKLKKKKKDNNNASNTNARNPNVDSTCVRYYSDMLIESAVDYHTHEAPCLFLWSLKDFPQPKKGKPQWHKVSDFM